MQFVRLRTPRAEPRRRSSTSAQACRSQSSARRSATLRLTARNHPPAWRPRDNRITQVKGVFVTREPTPASHRDDQTHDCVVIDGLQTFLLRQ